jgi:hypothetical protein
MKIKTIGLTIGGGVVLGVALYATSSLAPAKVLDSYKKIDQVVAPATSTASVVDGVQSVTTPVPFVASHLQTPVPLKAVYISSWVAGSKARRERVVNMIDTTEINAVVIDVKDSTGHISFSVTDPRLQKELTAQKRITDVREFIAELHKKNIYVIARIAVFQDPVFVIHHPELALKMKSDTTKLWKDSKKIAWLDAGSKEVWDYVLAIAHEAYTVGFDEANFDYIRYPSDGDLKNIYYPLSHDKIRAEVVNSFFQYVQENLEDKDMKTSADIFGLTTTEKGDLGIGQVLENALAHFDYVAPMVYPSHFAHGTYNIKDPATHPYEIVKTSMGKAVARAIKNNINHKKLRPWLQDFDLGATYTSEMVRAQISATYDVGLDSWMLWDPANNYTKEALLDDASAITEFATHSPVLPSFTEPIAPSTSTPKIN